MNLLPPMFDTFTPHDLTHYPPFQYIETPKMKSESDWNEKWSNQNDTHKQLMNQFFTHLRSWTSEYTILNMGLPVEEIMAEVEEELMNMNEEELHMDGEIHEDGEELNEDKEKDLDGIKLEVVKGNKEGSRWLIVDSVHICHKQQVFLNHDVWRCEDFRDYKCPFKIILTR